VIRVERAALPDGLRALAYRDHDGSLVIYVSEALSAASQRAAVIEAIRAARRTGWRAGLPLAGVAVILGAGGLLRRAARTLRARPAAWGAAATATAAVAAAGTYFLVTSPSPGHPAATQPGTVLPFVPKGQQSGRPSGPDDGNGAAPAGQHSPAPGPGPTVQNAKPAPAPAPSGNRPAPSAAPSPVPTPAPSQQPTPPASGHGLCIHLLGTTVCLRL
jgi:hypothetical protein